MLVYHRAYHMFHPGWLVFHREYRGIKDLISWEHHHILYHDLTMDFLSWSKRTTTQWYSIINYNKAVWYVIMGRYPDNIMAMVKKMCHGHPSPPMGIQTWWVYINPYGNGWNDKSPFSGTTNHVLTLAHVFAQLFRLRQIESDETNPIEVRFSIWRSNMFHMFHMFP